MMIDPRFIDEVSVDYWYDEDFLQSRNVLRAFSDSQWHELSQLWQLQSQEWQERLAYILGDSLLLREATLLVNMYRTASPSIALSAAESLRNMDVLTIREAIFQVTENRSVVERCNSINELLHVITPPNVDNAS